MLVAEPKSAPASDTAQHPPRQTRLPCQVPSAHGQQPQASVQPVVHMGGAAQPTIEQSIVLPPVPPLPPNPTTPVPPNPALPPVPLDPPVPPVPAPPSRTCNGEFLPEPQARSRATPSAVRFERMRAHAAGRVPRAVAVRPP